MTNLSKCLRIKIGGLVSDGLLRCDGVTKHFKMSWNNNESQISATIDMNVGKITFDYLCDGQPIHYSVDIERRTANIGFGEVYFFRIMHGGKAIYCKNLYLYNGLFVPRVMIPDAMYGCQIESKTYRNAIPHVEPFRKYGKPRYKGRITPYGKRINSYYESEDKARLALCRFLGLF